MESILQPKRFSWSGKANALWAVLIIIGIISFAATYVGDHQRAWTSYLVSYFYWLCICLSGFFFAALQHLTGSHWSVTVRRIPEIFTGFLPVLVILFVGLIFGIHSLYEWDHTHEVAKDVILSGKAGYLNKTFFIVRAGILFGVCFTLGRWMIKNSIRQDETGDANLTGLNTKISAPFILIFAWSFSFVAMDLMMSLEPHWFSTIFGVYCFAGLFSSGLAMITLWAVILKNKGPLQGFFNQEHLHDLGKLMFAFMVFWAYVGFSQFMLIWYGNLPEETFYYYKRLHGGWDVVSIALMIFKFGLPFLIMIGHAIKRMEKPMVFMAIWFLATQYLDIYWMVYPRFYESPVFGWQEVGVFLGFLGLFFLSVGWCLSRVSPVAIKDPRLEQALHFHQ